MATNFSKAKHGSIELSRMLCSLSVTVDYFVASKEELFEEWTRQEEQDKQKLLQKIGYSKKNMRYAENIKEKNLKGFKQKFAKVHETMQILIEALEANLSPDGYDLIQMGSDEIHTFIRENIKNEDE